MEWQPIETAPRDGECVIIWDGGSIVAPAVFVSGEWRFWDGMTLDDIDGGTVGFLNSWIRGYGPTHWMSLPKPPAAHD